MKNLISKEEKDRIDLICKDYQIKNYSINSDGSIDVNGDVDLRDCHLRKLPLQFGKVGGGFTCMDNDLISLDGSPHTVGLLFNCTNNNLTNLIGGPTTVGGNYTCNINILTSLMGAPTMVGGSFLCRRNKLVNLIGAPSTVGDGFIGNNKLTSTYSGDIDVEVGGDIYFSYILLPLLLQDNTKHIKLILKYQRHFEIWNDDLTLNEENFKDLISEIEDGLE